MRLSVTKHVAANHAAAPWLVVVPRRLSATGKRQFHYFRTRAGAETFAASVRVAVKRHGERPVALAAGEAVDARMAVSLLEGSGLNLVQAAQLAMQVLGKGEGARPAGTERGLPGAAEGGAGEAVATQAQKPPLPGRPRRLPTLASVLRDMQAARTHQSPHTLRSRMGRFHTFFRRNAGLARQPMAQLTAQQIQRALNRAWPKAPTSWNTMLTHLCALFNYAVRKGIIPANPLVSIDRRHVQEREIIPLSPEVLRALFCACRPPDAAARPARPALGTRGRRARHGQREPDTRALAPYIALAAFAGIRPTEITRLKWGDINLEDNCISVRRGASKTGGTRHVELHPTLRAWLEPLNPGGHPPGAFIFRAGSPLLRRLQLVRRRAGFHAGNPWPEDVLRHSYASYYLKAGGHIQQLQLNMGHASSALIYARYCNMRGLTRAMAAEWWALTPEACAQQICCNIS